MKKVVFVGGGASALIASILIKTSNKSLDVLIIEKNASLGKKLKASGSGRCNIAPITDDISLYHNKEFVENTIGKLSTKKQLDILSSIGIKTKLIKGMGYYPVSESASNLLTLLENKIKDLGIKIMLNSKVIDYSIKDNIVTLDNQKKIHFDHLIFSIGGASYASLGGEDTLSNVFIEHGYYFIKQRPTLTPIKVKENIHKLFGVRLPSEVSLYQDNKRVYKEVGEVQFRKDGLSGIVILNISRFIKDNKRYKIKINPFISKESNISLDEFKSLYKSNKYFLLSLLPKEIIEYGLSRLYLDEIKEKDLDIIYHYFSNMTFEFSKLFPLEFATVSRGGIDINDIDYKFNSKIEKNVSFLGEIIDVDGPCGGYSLRFAIGSGIIFARNLKL